MDVVINIIKLNSHLKLFVPRINILELFKGIICFDIFLWFPTKTKEVFLILGKVNLKLVHDIQVQQNLHAHLLMVVHMS